MKEFSLSGPIPSVVLDVDVLARDPSTSWTALDDQIVVLSGPRRVPHVLNTSAALVWQGLDGTSPVGEVVERVATQQGLAPQDISDDVRSVIRELRDSGLVSPVHRLHETRTDERPHHPPPSASPDLMHRALEKVPWCTTIGPFVAAASNIAIRTNSATIGRDLESLLGSVEPTSAPPSRIVSIVDRGDGPRRFTLFVDGRRVWSRASQDRLMEQLISDLNEVVASETSGHVVLHAGAIEKEGRVVVVVGSSGRGKSTLTTALVRRGWSYVTDEAVAIDVTSRRVRSYRKPVALDGESLELLGLPPMPDGPLRKALIPPAELGALSRGGDLALFVLLSDPSGFRPDEPIDALSRMGILLGMLTTAFPANHLDPWFLDALADIIEMTPVIHLARLGLEESSNVVEEAFAAARFPGRS